MNNQIMNQNNQSYPSTDGNNLNSGKIGTNQNTGNQMNPSMRVQSGMSSSMNNTKTKTLPKSVVNDPKYTENWLDLKGIKNGMMYNREGYIVSGVKIEPKNIFILENYQGDNIINGFMNFYNTIDYEFWLYIIDRPVDISVYQAELQLQYNKVTDPRIRKIIAQDLQKGDNFINNDVADIEYYLLFRDKKPEVIQKRIRDVINGLASCGITASPANDDDLRALLDNILNGGKKYEAGSVMF